MIARIWEGGFGKAAFRESMSIASPVHDLQQMEPSNFLWTGEMPMRLAVKFLGEGETNNSLSGVATAKLPMHQQIIPTTVMQETLTKLCIMQTQDTKVEGGAAGEQ